MGYVLDLLTWWDIERMTESKRMERMVTFLVGKKDEAYWILEEMKISGCKPHTVTYNAKIHGFCIENDFDAAYKVLDHMVEEECKPNGFAPFSEGRKKIVDGLCEKGDMELLIKVLSSLGNANLIGVDTWELVICSMAYKKEILSISNVYEKLNSLMVP
ncbi:hypothetical protein F8388_019619 [Cannabis sativa]|uniref:Pentatricopeptide repeat-containing protein n=1 Tax=Cannabis sativa TaxID=3483 RepID=A0A7J6DVU9_CANSA|nr:hypothetical protein F8388_019619 [Cannabis sativa]KAF4351570.1 hypothetical protein G4B88_000608 [Cannabis sativa]